MTLEEIYREMARVRAEIFELANRGASITAERYRLFDLATMIEQ